MRQRDFERRDFYEFAVLKRNSGVASHQKEAGTPAIGMVFLFLRNVMPQNTFPSLASKLATDLKGWEMEFPVCKDRF
ncbi:hypothetical protein HGO37_03295 [Rhizobium sp. CG4]|uniref:hypothetical protein n=1 Tax=Rhizobium/Agrobacterium group TaxID=227290 RepID=UPI0020339F26|nr:hypothetical protein [Rhizobium sp. CG4]MCM2454403.1 hypothetical protein [Rhizobium sp. CG4]